MELSLINLKFDPMENEKQSSRRPDPAELRYGQDQYSKGFEEGYKRCMWDLRKRKSTKERCLIDKFNLYVDYLEDEFSSHRKR